MAEKRSAEEQNRESESRAHQILYEAVQQVLTQLARSVKVKSIVLRIPVQGDRLGTPTRSIEIE